MSDVLDARRRGSLDAERVGNVLPVRPRLHQSRSCHGHSAHGRAVPRKLGTGRGGGESLDESGAPRSPIGEQLRRRAGRLLGSTVVDKSRRIHERRLQLLRKPVRVGDRQDRSTVRPVQVPDLMRDAPPFRRRHCRPLLLGQIRNQGVEALAFGPQVIDERLKFGHATSITLGFIKIKHE